MCPTCILLTLAMCLATTLVAAGSDRAPRDVSFLSKLDGSTQRYVEILPPGTRPAKPDVMIALHGHGSDRWQFAKDARAECQAARDVAAAHRMIFVAPDYRASTSWMGPAAEADLVQIIAIYRAKGVGRIVLTGASMGGAATLIFAARHPEAIDAACAMNPTANMVEYTGFADAVAAAYGGTRTEQPEEYRKRSPELFPERFAGMPVSITAGGKDTTVPPASALRLVKLLETQSARDVLLIYRPEGGHSTDYVDAKAALEFAAAGAKRRNPVKKPRAVDAATRD